MSGFAWSAFTADLARGVGFTAVAAVALVASAGHGDPARRMLGVSDPLPAESYGTADNFPVLRPRGPASSAANCAPVSRARLDSHSQTRKTTTPASEP